jgi:hypothetical protein
MFAYSIKAIYLFTAGVYYKTSRVYTLNKIKCFSFWNTTKPRRIIVLGVSGGHLKCIFVYFRIHSFLSSLLGRLQAHVVVSKDSEIKKNISISEYIAQLLWFKWCVIRLTLLVGIRVSCFPCMGHKQSGHARQCTLFCIGWLDHIHGVRPTGVCRLIRRDWSRALVHSSDLVLCSLLFCRRTCLA